MILLALDFKDINESFYSEDGKSLIKVNDTSPYLRISAKCEKIQNECFNGLISLISFSFEDNPNLTTIGSNSFNDCLFLTTINLSYCNKLKYIREKAFYGCNRVEKILLPKGLLEISSGAFIYCNLIKSILVPASVEKIGDRAFVSCSKLENVTFEEGSNLTSLEHHVFYDTNITSFQIPEKVSKINGAAFSDAKLTNLTIHPKNKFFVIENNNFVLSPNKSILFFICNKSSEIPDSVTTLGDSCFENSNIKSITFPNSVISLGENCFWGTNFQTIELPGSLITIGVGCFFGSPINSITIPENVKNINSYAFNFCTNLTNITFLGPFDYIGRGVFEYCISLELIIFHCPPFIIFGDYFISRTSPDCTMCFANKTLFSNETIQKNMHVSVSYINEPDLIITTDSMIMNSKQTEIYEYWGYNYTNGITIHKSVTKIKERAFENSDITKIYFESNSALLEIGDYAFKNCSRLFSFNLSYGNLNTLGFGTFSNCMNLTSVNFASNNFMIMGNAFENCTNLLNVSNMLNIPNKCFSGCTQIKNINIDEGSIHIGEKSFENCYCLESINIPSSVETISENSFLNCRNLKSIIFSSTNSLSEISYNSFRGCNSLQNISNFESDNYKCIDNTLYYKNESKYYLIYHVINSSENSLILNCNVICSYSFNECNNIYNITILPNTVSLIEQYSFNNCLNLQHINFPLSAETVESHSFFECRSICCPLIIENTTIDYLNMIVGSGIPRRLIISCGIYHNSKKHHSIKSICNSSVILMLAT